MHVFVFFSHIFLGTGFKSHKSTHNCYISCRASLALRCILLVRLNFNGSVCIRHFSEFKCTKAWRCPWHIFCSRAGFQRFLMCGLARWVLITTLHMFYDVFSRSDALCMETCTPECCWVCALKCISLSFWVHSSPVLIVRNKLTAFAHNRQRASVITMCMHLNFAAFPFADLYSIFLSAVHVLSSISCFS